ncbi:hypothetical protein KKH18_14025 [bacterium]|nr:hypothetical protein [bacterium]
MIEQELNLNQRRSALEILDTSSRTLSGIVDQLELAYEKRDTFILRLFVWAAAGMLATMVILKFFAIGKTTSTENFSISLMIIATIVIALVGITTTSMLSEKRKLNKLIHKGCQAVGHLDRAIRLNSDIEEHITTDPIERFQIQVYLSNARLEMDRWKKIRGDREAINTSNDSRTSDQGKVLS